MKRTNPYFYFVVCTASLVVFMGSISSLSRAQMSHAQQMENDSLNLMIQQWHSLPEASVQTIGLAAGAKGRTAGDDALRRPRGCVGMLEDKPKMRHQGAKGRRQDKCLT